MILRVRDFSGGLQGGITPKDRAPNSLAVLKDLELDRPYLALSRRQVFNSVLGGTLPGGVVLEGSGIRARLRKGQITVLRGTDNKFYLRESGNYAVVTRTDLNIATSNPVMVGGSCGFAVAANALRIAHVGNLSAYDMPIWISHFDRKYFRTGASTWFAEATGDLMRPSTHSDISNTTLMSATGISASDNVYGQMPTGTYFYAASFILDGYQETKPVVLFSQALTGAQDSVQFTLRVTRAVTERITGCTIYRLKQDENVWWALFGLDFTYDSSDGTKGIIPYYKGRATDPDRSIQINQYWTSDATYITNLVTDTVGQTELLTSMNDLRGFSPMKLKQDNTWVAFNLIDRYRDIAVARGRTFVVGTLDDERKVFYCNLNGDGVFEHDVFPIGNYLEFPKRVQRIVEDNESLRVFTESGIHRVIFGGDSRNDWNIEMGEAESGTRSPRSVSVLQGRPLFLGQDTLREIRGEQSTPVPGLPIQDIIDATSDLTTVYAEVRPARGEYWLGINSRLVVLKENAWREITKANLNIIQTENGEVALVTASDLLSLASPGSESFGVEIKTNILDFDQPEYLKRLGWIELIYQCDTAVTVEIFYDRSGTAGTTLTFPIQTAYSIQKQYFPIGKHAKELEVRITAPSTHTSFRLEELSMSADVVRKFGEG